MKVVACHQSLKSRWKLAPVILALLAASGCSKPDPGPPNMMPEILGALAIREGAERDAALAKACRESADQCSAPAVLMGLPRIENADLRDEVAADCAATLDDGGQTSAGVDVAKLITNISKRDALLAKLKGP